MAPKQRTSKRARHTQDDVPQVYLDMLREEAQSHPSGQVTRQSPRKKQKVTQQPSQATEQLEIHEAKSPTESNRPSQSPKAESQISKSPSTHHYDPQPQTIYDDSDSSSDSDVDWEKLLSKETGNDNRDSDDEKPKAKDISLDLGSSEKKSRPSKIINRLPSTAIELRKRLNIHKLHVLCLFVHVYIRNAWSYDDDVRARVKPLMPDKTKSLFHLGPERNQFDRSNHFIKGLESASLLWRDRFRIVEKGLTKPSWSLEPDKAQVPLEKISAFGSTSDDFKTAAKNLKGSRDLGAQLFAAFLRSAGVSVRLICSLQTLPFGNVAVTEAPEQSQSNVISASGDASPTSLRQHSSPSKRTPDSRYPIFWVEAFNIARQKWVPVDPFVTETVAKPNSLEPPANDRLNMMSYVLAVDEEGAIRDVTRRYAKAYNAKTIKSRVEASSGGAKWYKTVLKVFKGRENADRDTIEDAELAQREAAEPLPRNVQDFKGHPYYALERHLKHNEVIHPKKQSGKVAVGKGPSASVEPIYRRANVQIVKNADKWYRSGREIKAGEQPLKIGRKRQRRFRSLSVDDHASDEEDNSVGLYAHFQTNLYESRPAVDGKVPRNAFGNLDVYVPSMIPFGAVHVRSNDAASAARSIDVDYADAVIGFQFKGRQGTAVMRGVVVAKEYREAVEQTIEALRYQREYAEEQKKSQEALRLWKRFWKGLKIRDRIMSESGSDEAQNIADNIDDAEKAEEKASQQGGFFLDKDAKTVPQPTNARRNVTDDPFQEDDLNTRLRLTGSDKQLRSRDFFEPTVTSPWDSTLLSQSRHAVEQKTEITPQGADLVPASDEKMSEGFIPDDLFEEAGGGGFIPEEVEDPLDQQDAGRSFEVEKASGVRFIPDAVEEAVEAPIPFQTSHPPQNRLPPDKVDFGDVTHAARSNDSPEPKAKPNLPKENLEEGREDEPHASKNASDEEDNVSLLSHDPEDDDAEPEWLFNEASL